MLVQFQVFLVHLLLTIVELSCMRRRYNVGILLLQLLHELLLQFIFVLIGVVVAVLDLLFALFIIEVVHFKLMLLLLLLIRFLFRVRVAPSPSLLLGLRWDLLGIRRLLAATAVVLNDLGLIILTIFLVHSHEAVFVVFLIAELSHQVPHRLLLLR